MGKSITQLYEQIALLNNENRILRVDNKQGGDNS